MRRALAVLGLVMAGVMFIPAAASGRVPSCSTKVAGTTDKSSYGVGVQSGCTLDETKGDGPDTSADVTNAVVQTTAGCSSGGNCQTCPPGEAFMVTTLSKSDGSSELLFVGCLPSAASSPRVTPGDVANAFARLALPASELTIQPPDGLTLVNFDTNFYTLSTKAITRRVTLLGQHVTIEASPSRYIWRFDDGVPLRTTEPGAPYPDLVVTHSYARKGSYRPSLDTVYSGRYRVGSGPWQTIPGTVTVAGARQRLRAIEAQPKLVSY